MDNNKASSFSPSSSFDSLCSSSFPKYPSFNRNYKPAYMAGPRSPRYFSPFPGDDDYDVDGARHFLDSCHLCGNPIGSGRDIFMYKGDTPFCSEECRQEQMEMDEAEEKRIKRSRKQQFHHHQQQKSAAAKDNKSSAQNEKIHLRVSGTVVAG